MVNHPLVESVSLVQDENEDGDYVISIEFSEDVTEQQKEAIRNYGIDMSKDYSEQIDSALQFQQEIRGNGGNRVNALIKRMRKDSLPVRKTKDRSNVQAREPQPPGLSDKELEELRNHQSS